MARVTAGKWQQGEDGAHTAEAAVPPSLLGWGEGERELEKARGGVAERQLRLARKDREGGEGGEIGLSLRGFPLL